MFATNHPTLLFLDDAFIARFSFFHILTTSSPHLSIIPPSNGNPERTTSLSRRPQVVSPTHCFQEWHHRYLEMSWWLALFLEYILKSIYTGEDGGRLDGQGRMSSTPPAVVPDGKDRSFHVRKHTIHFIPVTKRNCCSQNCPKIDTPPFD